MERMYLFHFETGCDFSESKDLLKILVDELMVKKVLK